MKIIGITGTIGSGKTTILNSLQKRGFLTVDADRVVHELYEPNQPGSRKIGSLFGKSFLDRSGKVDRGKLSEFIFGEKKSSSESKIKRINEAIHPLVYKKIQSMIRVMQKKVMPGKEVIFVESTYFDAKNLGRLIDLLVRVDSKKELCYKRLKKKKHLQKNFNLIWKMQKNEQKKYRAHYTVINNTQKKDLRKKIEILMRKLTTSKKETISFYKASGSPQD